MQTIKAIYDGANFKLKQPIPIQGEYEVFITFVEPIETARTKAVKPPVEYGEISALGTEKLPRSTAKGLLKGKVWMSKDFDEPLEDMREYME